METKSIKLEVDIAADAHEIYETLMDEKKHADLVDASAEIDPTVDGKFSLWDGTITGKTLELVPDEKIVQEWRSDEEGWPEDHFSKLTIELEKNGDATHITLTQTGIPENSAENVEQGWTDYYFEPMKEKLEK